MNEAININEHRENVKTSGIWMIITAAFAGFWGFFDALYLVDAVYLICACLVLFRQSKNALLVALICMSLAGFQYLNYLKAQVTATNFRAYVTYIFWKGYRSAFEISKVNSGKQASLNIKVKKLL